MLGSQTSLEQFSGYFFHIHITLPYFCGCTPQTKEIFFSLFKGLWKQRETKRILPLLVKEKYREYWLGNVGIVSLCLSRVNIIWALFSLFLHGDMKGARIPVHAKKNKYNIAWAIWLSLFLYVYYVNRNKTRTMPLLVSLWFVKFFTKRNKDTHSIVWSILLPFVVSSLCCFLKNMEKTY